MPQMGGMRGGSGSMGGNRGNGPMGGNRGNSPMGGNGPMGAGSPMKNPMGAGRQEMGRQERMYGEPMNGRNSRMGAPMEPFAQRRPMEPQRKPMRFGADPRHAAPFGLIVADVIWNRAHFNRIRRVLEKMVYNEPISPIEERVLWESFGRRIEYYEAQELLAWVDRELSYL